MTMYESYKSTYRVLAVTVSAATLLPETLIGSSICTSYEEIVKVFASSLATLAALSVIALIFADYLSSRLLVKHYLQPILLGGFLAGVLHLLMFIWLFRELRDVFLFVDNVVNLYLFTQTVSYATILVAIAYLSSE